MCGVPNLGTTSGNEVKLALKCVLGPSLLASDLFRRGVIVPRKQVDIAGDLQ